MYKYSIEQCDVLDKERLRAFRNKRAEWISWLLGDDQHSIWNQVSSLLWDNTLFLTVNDLRRDGLEKPNTNVGFNGAIMRMFDAGFVATQVTAIRRLTDRQPRNPEKGVISLRRLVEDIEKNRELITREVYVAYDGLAYDYTAAQNTWIENKVSKGSLGAGFEYMPTDGPTAWGVSQMVHGNFDKLSNSSGSTERSRVQLIDSDLFDVLNEHLDVCEDVRKYTDKFVAHAAEPASRSNLSESETNITLNRLNECNKVIYEVADFVFGRLLWEGSHSAVPAPQYNHLENLEKGWIAAERIVEAHEIWQRHEKAKNWSSEYLWPKKGR